MHIALLADGLWLNQELPLLGSLVQGLTGQGVQVTLITGQSSRETASALEWPVTGLSFPDSRWARSRRGHVADLARPLRPAAVDVIHALSGALWEGAVDLAQALGAATVLAAYASDDLPHHDRLWPALPPDSRLAVAAASVPLVEALRRQAGPRISVEWLPPGLARSAAPAVQGPPPQAPTAPPATDPSARTVCLGVAASGLVDGHLMSALQGLRRVCEAHPDLQLFFDTGGDDPHGLWLTLTELGLSRCANLVPQRPQRGNLLLSADALLYPQPLGRVRSLLLGALARGQPLLAGADPWLDCLIPDETAWVIHHPAAGIWHETLEHLIAQPEAAGQLGQRARAWICRHDRPADQTTRLLDLYQRLTPRTIPFPAVR